jgi:hypothetical protein
MMMRWQNMALVALMLTVTPVRAQGQKSADIDKEQLAEINAMLTDTNIDWVQTGGRWDEGEQGGQYRIVVTESGFEHVRRQLFIQWIKRPKHISDSYEVVRTLAVKELGYVWTIEPRLKFDRDGKLHIALAITRPDSLHDDGVREKRMVTVWPDGHYDFK